MTPELIAEEIIKEAISRMEQGISYSNTNSAISAVNLEVLNILMDVMKDMK